MHGPMKVKFIDVYLKSMFLE